MYHRGAVSLILSRRLVTLAASLGGAASLLLTVGYAQTVGAGQAQPPTFRAATTLVTTDVIPRDANGRFVADLTPAEFTVLEDGVPQTLESFSLVRGGRITNLLQPTPPVVEGLIVPQRRPGAGAGGGRVVLIVVDDLHFEAEYTPHVRRLIQTMAKTLLHEEDLVAMISSGPSAVEISGTHDRALIAAAASQVRGSAVTAAEIFQMPETSQGAADLRRRAQVAFQTTYRLLRELEEVRDRRKVVLYISSGYDLDPFVAGRQSADRIQGGRASDPTRFLVETENPYQRLPAVTADLDLFAYMRELTLAANRANATLYTVDPRGLSGVVDAGQAVDQSEWRTFLQKTQSSLRYLAQETGGYAVVNVNDFAREFARIDAETSDYYLLGYTSTNRDRSRRVRRLEVQVRRPGVTAAARAAYSLGSQDPPATTGGPARP
ncbi:MAG: VWA domain-containing protein [Vicinamibacterales bacterium]